MCYRYSSSEQTTQAKRCRGRHSASASPSARATPKRNDARGADGICSCSIRWKSTAISANDQRQVSQHAMPPYARVRRHGMDLKHREREAATLLVPGESFKLSAQPFSSLFDLWRRAIKIQHAQASFSHLGNRAASGYLGSSTSRPCRQGARTALMHASSEAPCSTQVAITPAASL